MNNAFRVPLRASGGMPEYRQQSAGPQPGTDVSARYDDRAASIMLAQANRNAQAEAQGWEQFNRGLQTFLKAGNKLYTDYRDKTSKSHITEALLRAQEEFATWQQDYDASHQGEAGIQAATDYENAWKHINQTHMQTLRERGVSGPYERHADLLFRQNGLHYAKAGTAFQQQQDRRWKSSLADGAFTALQNFVSSNPDDYERIGELKAQALSAYALAHPGEDMRAFEQKLNNAVATDSLNARLANGDWQGAERDLGIYGGATSLPHSYTGQARVLAKHESGNLGSAHVSYGLPRTDGVDVGKYSFITKGGHGGSVGEFLRWAGTQSGLGKQLHDKFQALTGGDWNKLDSKEFWKSKGGQAAWQEMVKSNPEAFERLEDSFWLPRLERQFSKLRPEVQQAIQADKTGALREMALSTLNQHKTAIKILNDNFDPNPETYIRNVYADRAQPARFAATGDPGIGQRRMRQEVQDVLGIFRGQASAPASVSSPGSQKRPETSMSEAAQSIGDTASSWLTPQQRLTYASRIQAEKNRQQQLADLQSVRQLADSLRSLPAEERAAQGYAALDQIQDPQQRQHMRTALDAQLAEMDRRDKAEFAMQGRQIAAQLKGKSLLERNEYFTEHNTRPEVQKIAVQLLDNNISTSPVALSQAKDDIAQGASLDDISARYGALISAKDMQELHVFAQSEDKKRQHKKLSAFMAEMVAKSGLDMKDEDDKAYVLNVKSEFEEAYASGQFKTLLEQKNWIYERLARRRVPGLLWGENEITPLKAQDREKAYVPVPPWAAEDIVRQLVQRGITAPTEEDIQRVYNAQLASRGVTAAPQEAKEAQEYDSSEY